jgi:hypothetical protein
MGRSFLIGPVREFHEILRVFTDSFMVGQLFLLILATINLKPISYEKTCFPADDRILCDDAVIHLFLQQQ